MKKIIVVIVAALATIVAAHTAIAQINPFGKWAQAGLTKEDSEMSQKAAASLYEKPDVKAGDSASWQNPTSGNSGTVTATRVFKHKDMPCVGLRYAFDLKDSQDKSKKELQANRCKVASGEWKILH
jgi:surface antigen